MGEVASIANKSGNGDDSADEIVWSRFKLSLDVEMCIVASFRLLTTALAGS